MWDKLSTVLRPKWHSKWCLGLGSQLPRPLLWSFPRAPLCPFPSAFPAGRPHSLSPTRQRCPVPCRCPLLPQLPAGTRAGHPPAAQPQQVRLLLLLLLTFDSPVRCCSIIVNFNEKTLMSMTLTITVTLTIASYLSVSPLPSACSIVLGAASLPLVFTYPLAKRFTFWVRP